MSIKCDLCGKAVRFGHTISHSQRHTKRRWLPNIRRATLVIKGQKKQVNICMRCLRTQHKISQ